MQGPTIEKTIEIEADSLQEARNQVKSSIPKDLYLLSEKVISDGRSIIARGIADT